MVSKGQEMNIDVYGNFAPIWPNICIFDACDMFEVVKEGRESQKSPPISEASRVNGIVLGLDFSISLLTLRVG